MPLLIRLLIRPSLFAVALCATFVGCSRDTREAPNVAEQAQPAADLILTNGKIFTMDPQRSWAQALAVSDGRIVYVGTEQGVRAYRGDASKLVDLQQKMVLPGFQDVHIHPVSGGVAYTGCALFDLDTLQLVLDKIASCAREEFSSGRLQATAVKFWADGILETHTARLLEPYTDQPDTRGLLMVPKQEMMAAVPLLDAAGFQIHVHAIGDATVRYALDAFEKAQTANGKRDSRHLTAHTQLVHPDDLSRFAALQAIAGFSPYWAYADSYVAEINPPQLGAQRMSWMYPIRSILDTGARVAFGSDWFVSTADPLLGIETAITRSEPDGEATPVFIPAQRISLTQAIAGYTIDAAYANFLDADTGSLEVGKFADLVVLDTNLFAIPAADISEARVVATVLEGDVVYGKL